MPRKRKNVEAIESFDKELFDKLPQKPSKYQKPIFEWMLHGQGNAIINAVPGSGKTTTLVNAVTFTKSTDRCIFIAFNKEIVNELNSRLEKYKNIVAKTVHSIGYSILRRNYYDINMQLDDYKYSTYIKRNIESLANLKLKKLTKRERLQYIDNVISLTDLARVNICYTPSEIKRKADFYNIELIDDEPIVVEKIIEWGKENIETVDYTDMIWLPYIFGLDYPYKKFDWLFVDELQDLSELQREIIMKCASSSSRMLLVGDKNQSIYSFAGASVDSFDKWEQLPNTTSFPLSICYRCPKSVINYANELIPSMEAKKGAEDGEVSLLSTLDDVQDGDMVLCRTNFPLISTYMSFLKKGKKCYIRGSELGKNLITTIRTKKCDELNVSLNEKGLFSELYYDMFEEKDKLMKERKISNEDALTYDNILAKYDNIKILETLSNGLTKTDELIELIETIFNQSDTNGICLATVHKAKGLEADNVYILCNSLLNDTSKAKQDWEKIQEKNLAYVAYTRAKKKMGFISEKEVAPSFNKSDSTNIIRVLKLKEKKINSLYGRQSLIDLTPEECIKASIEEIKELKPVVKTNSITLKNINERGKQVEKKFKITTISSLEDLNSNSVSSSRMNSDDEDDLLFKDLENIVANKKKRSYKKRGSF